MGLLENGMLQVLSSCEKQTVLLCLMHQRKKCFAFNRIFLRMRFLLFLLGSEKRKTFYTITLAIKFYYGDKKEHLFSRIIVTMKKKPGKK